MSYGYGYWGRPQRDLATHEKAWVRKGLAAWDAKWHGLSQEARRAFLEDVKMPAKDATRVVQPSVAADSVPPAALKELTDAGFVRVEASKRGDKPDRVSAVHKVYEFTTRLRALKRYRLLSDGGDKELLDYVNFCFFSGQRESLVFRILQPAGVGEYPHRIDEPLKRYVASHRWPGWAVASLKDPLAEKVYEALRKAGRPVPVAELPGKVKGSDPNQVRRALDDLVGHLVVFEDLDRSTWDLVAGLLPAVRKGLEEADRPRKRPALAVCESPRDLGPDGSVVVNDLRAFLLELVSAPPRLRQDHSFFQKELDRFLAALEPVPDWLSSALKWSREVRLTEAGKWARRLGLVRNLVDGKEIHLHLSDKGRTWLSGPPGSQYESVYKFLNRTPEQRQSYTSYGYGYDDTAYETGYYEYSPGDSGFLGINVAAAPAKQERKANRFGDYWDAKPKDYLALRESVYRAFDELSPGVFYRLRSVLAHAAFGHHNPLELGLDPREVVVYLGALKVPPFEEERNEAVRHALDALVRLRLIPLGCVRAARDESGELCVARGPGLDAYFGREGAKIEVPAAAAGESRVVVQPDFSVIVIGLNPAPAAELAPFCERTTRNAGAGAIVLKLTRDAVVKAVSHGLAPDDILERLGRLASNDLPANVLKEVRGWCGWVRQVSPTTLTVLRCGDRETADRALTALGKQAERVNETLVAVPRESITAADRAKLQSHGIVLSKGGTLGAGTPTPKAKAKRRGRRW
jgi:hypothetical protein